MSIEHASREIQFPDSDTPLRDDVRVLGALVGEILREQGGEALYRDVEAARMAAIERRENPNEGEATETLEHVLFGRGPEDGEALVRAFSTYFQVVNLAETVHRLRRRRDYLREDTPQPRSLLDTVTRLKAGGASAEQAHAALASLCLEPVFTAHPTEATRRTMLRKRQRIARLLVQRMDSSITPPESRAALGRIRSEVTAGWQTDEHPSERLTVADEREHVLFFLTEVLYRVVPPFYEAMDEAMEAVYGAGEARGMPTILRFVSWVGGDMDGNPNVTAVTLRETLHRHRELILKRYLGEFNDLYGQLSQTPDRAAFDDAVTRRIETDERHQEVLASVPARHRDMPYRVLLTLMHRRLERTLGDGDDVYSGAPELSADLQLIADSLTHNQGSHAGLFAVRRMIRRVATFGFHLATLDVRQDAEVHRRVIGQLLGEASWEELPAAERATRLRQVLKDREPPGLSGTDLPEEVETTLEVYRAIAESLERYGRGAIGPYIISMAQNVDDVLSVLVLARWAGLVDQDDRVPLDVAPLFETVPDLEASGEVMTALLSDADYRAHVAWRGDRQTVMIGYSDSNKDGGLAAARWALYRGQKILVDALAPAGVALTIFHGRGGTTSRGGGKISRAVEAMPEGALGTGSLRLTEQGEIINAKYGLRGIALRTLEQMASAVVGETTVSCPPSPQPSPSEGRGGQPLLTGNQWSKVMDELSAASRDAYRGLVYDTPELYDYFRQATPIDVIERLQIGSRPASRRKGGGIGSLRAIPWVFSWMQSRHVLPGWYGLGTGLETAVGRHGEDAIAEMARSWPFLHVLLDDAEMVLAKADLRIAARYAGLVEGAYGEVIFGRIRDEFERTVELILRLKGNSGLLDDDPMLQRSIRLRNPYIDPMSLLQVDLLRRWRATDRRDEGLRRALMATVNGIAQGLKNTG